MNPKLELEGKKNSIRHESLGHFTEPKNEGHTEDRAKRWKGRDQVPITVKALRSTQA